MVMWGTLCFFCVMSLVFIGYIQIQIQMLTLRLIFLSLYLLAERFYSYVYRQSSSFWLVLFTFQE